MYTMSDPDTQLRRPRRLAYRPSSHLAALSLGLLALSLNACSNKAMYEMIRQDNLRACEAIPIAQQAGCKAQYQKDYATYKRERDSLKEIDR